MELDPSEMTAVIARMKRAHGHLASVIRMMEEGGDCAQVLTQLSAVNKALSRSGYAIVTTGLRQCVDAKGELDAADAQRLEKLFLTLA